MISNSILDDLRMVGCGEGDDARQEDMRAASAAYDEIERLREALEGIMRWNNRLSFCLPAEALPALARARAVLG